MRYIVTDILCDISYCCQEIYAVLGEKVVVIDIKGKIGALLSSKKKASAERVITRSADAFFLLFSKYWRKNEHKIPFFAILPTKKRAFASLLGKVGFWRLCLGKVLASSQQFVITVGHEC